MPSRTSSGAMTNPTLNPVIAKLFEKPFRIIVLSSIPLKEAMDMCLKLYVSSPYISSEITKQSSSITASAISSSSFLL